MKLLNGDFTGEQALANAIVIKAMEDYEKALITINKNPKSYTASDTINEIKRFVKSDWFMLLTKFDGEELLKRVEQQTVEKIKKQKQKNKK